MAISIVIVVTVVAALVGIAFAMDRPSFCMRCHEMRPFYDAWKASAHKGTECISCHVDPGWTARLSHKLVALHELRVHLFGDPRFPVARAPVLPDARCRPCHPAPKDSPEVSFSHRAHGAKVRCQGCHAESGHAVDTTALVAAGIAATDVARSPSTASASPTVQPSPRATPTASAGGTWAHHAATPCLGCHAPTATACSYCHNPKHETTRTGTCDLCHPTGSTWAFKHPAARQGCAKCHEPPARHFDGACHECHPGTARWVFSHPRSLDCERCHDRPAGHAAGACSGCHRASRSWAFFHPPSQECQECHKAPSGHFPGACAECHTPRIAFANTAFNHPPLEEHSYTSFPCASCHPAGLATASCTECHGPGGPEEGD